MSNDFTFGLDLSFGSTPTGLAAGRTGLPGPLAPAALDQDPRQVYALSGLVKKWGANRVETACRTALDAEAVHVPLIARMLGRGTEQPPAAGRRPQATVVSARFAPDPSHFAVTAGRGGAA